MLRNPNMDQHLERLRSLLRDLGSVLVCYSGGVDTRCSAIVA
jgi:PP-loop superfamily ATP-utilizing enzyme